MPVSPEMAVRLGKFCGNGPELWPRMQQAYDLWHAERDYGRGGEDTDREGQGGVSFVASCSPHGALAKCGAAPACG